MGSIAEWRETLMCTFKDERTVLVCDVAISHVRREMEVALAGGGVRYTGRGRS